jgi:predicted AAA+ superfamily ATPase
LREEIQAKALTRNLEGFSRFLQITAKRAGLLIDITKLAKEAKIHRLSCFRFIEILEDTLLGFRCEPFSDCEADTFW